MISTQEADEDPVVKVADFGLAKTIDNDTRLRVSRVLYTCALSVIDYEARNNIQTDDVWNTCLPCARGLRGRYFVPCRIISVVLIWAGLQQGKTFFAGSLLVCAGRTKDLQIGPPPR